MAYRYLAAEHLDPGDVAAARGNVFLHQRGLVDARGRCVPRRPPAPGPRACRSDDAGAAAADVRLHHHGEAEALGRGRRSAGWLITRAAGNGRPSDFSSDSCSAFDVSTRTPRAVDDPHAELLEVRQVAGCRRSVTPAAQVRRRAHPVEDQPVLAAVAWRVVPVRPASSRS